MATSKNNILTHGLSGKVGDLLVFRQRGGKTIVGKVPDMSEIERTGKQKAVTRKFQEAVIYAKAAIADDSLKEAYKEKTRDGQTAYNVAIADFFNAPDIEEIDLSGYTGKAGEQIVVRATDDFKVAQVTVAIYTSDGTLVEKGEATLGTNGVDWTYQTTVTSGQVTGDKIVVQASDLPGNLTERQESM